MKAIQFDIYGSPDAHRNFRQRNHAGKIILAME